MKLCIHGFRTLRAGAACPQDCLRQQMTCSDECAVEYFRITPIPDWTDIDGRCRNCGDHARIKPDPS